MRPRLHLGKPFAKILGRSCARRVTPLEDLLATAVDVPGAGDLEAAGNFLDHEYAFERAGREVARASKRWISLSDTYSIDIEEGEDAVLILAAAVVIDLVSHPDEDKN